MVKSLDIVIFGAGIAGLWTFNRLKSMGYDVLLLEVSAIGSGQTIASQGIIHSGLKFSIAGKVSNLAKSISNMPERWRACLGGAGEIDLSAAKINATSQQMLIPKGFMGNLTNIITRKTLGDLLQEKLNDRAIPLHCNSYVYISSCEYITKQAAGNKTLKESEAPRGKPSDITASRVTFGHNSSCTCPNIRFLPFVWTHYIHGSKPVVFTCL